MAESITYGAENKSQGLDPGKETPDIAAEASNLEDNQTETMNATRLKLIEDFRNQLKDVLKPEHSDKYLMKWLKSSNFNLKRAATLFRQNLYTRAVYKLDNFDSEIWPVPEVIEKYEFNGYMGTAKDGSPIRYVSSGRGDYLGFIKSLSIFKVCIYCSRIIEADIKALEMQKKITGEDIDGITYIFDMEEMSLLQLLNKPVLETGLDLLKMLQDHYPSIWKVIILVNAPYYFDKVYTLFKPILRSSLADKIKVKSKENSTTELLKWIDADVLPAFLGGNKTDSKEDPFCKEFLKFGGQIPQEFYLMNNPVLMETDPGVKTLWVPARSVHNLMTVVKEPGSKIRLQFRTEGAGIGMCLMYKKLGPDPNNIEMPPVDQYLDEFDENSGVECISPPVIAQTHISPIDDDAFCPWPGIYIMRLDNTYSWFNGKKVIYKFWVAPPTS